MPSKPILASSSIAIIGAGPAGLMAAEALAKAGYSAHVFDAMPSVARKFLLAGVGGMNITHAEDYSTFLTRYGSAQAALQPILDQLPPEQLRDWIHNLGIETFVGSSQRVFPKDMKAAPLLRAWQHRLREQGIAFHPHHRWTGWLDNDPQRGWCFDVPDGVIVRQFDAVILALGGASWSKLGSDGSWCKPLSAAGIKISPLQPSNCGFEIAWSPFIKEHFTGTPIKNIQLSLTDLHGKTWKKTGEFVVSDYGIEGSLIYALSAPLRELINTNNSAVLWLDWLPHYTAEQITTKLAGSRKGMSLSNLLRKSLKLSPIAIGLLKENYPELSSKAYDSIAQALKRMPLQPFATRPIDEAISSAGGISWDSVDDNLMLKQLPGIFAAGEMLDWEAPTGGYLLTGCFATGKRAGIGVAKWLTAKAQTS